MEVIGKKLLVLGGSKLMEVIVNKAKSLGIYTIVTDNRPLSAAPVKLLADEYHDIDFSNYSEIKRNTYKYAKKTIFLAMEVRSSS